MQNVRAARSDLLFIKLESSAAYGSFVTSFRARETSVSVIAYTRAACFNTVHSRISFPVRFEQPPGGRTKLLRKK